MSSQDLKWMTYALELAREAQSYNEVPVGAVVVKDNKVIGTGYNQSISQNNPCGHAEIIALQNAGKNVNNYRLINAEIYVTLEPCTMCVGAMIHSRVSRLIYAASDPKTGMAGTCTNLFETCNFNHKIQITHGVLAQESSQLLKDFFRQRR